MASGETISVPEMSKQVAEESHSPKTVTENISGQEIMEQAANGSSSPENATKDISDREMSEQVVVVKTNLHDNFSDNNKISEKADNSVAVSGVENTNLHTAQLSQLDMPSCSSQNCVSEANLEKMNTDSESPDDDDDGDSDIREEVILVANTSEDVEMLTQIENEAKRRNEENESSAKHRKKMKRREKDNAVAGMPVVEAQVNQKRCLMLNLRELHARYLARHPKNYVTFAAFCSLRPSWCLHSRATALSEGRVCLLHENLKLMVDALPSESLYTYSSHQLKLVTYDYFIEKLLCFNATELCKVGKCLNCPVIRNVKNFLTTCFRNSDYDPDDRVQFYQWVTNGTMQLEYCMLTVEEFIDGLCAACIELLEHHQTSKAQSAYYKKVVSSLTRDKAVIHMDFSENYYFPSLNSQNEMQWSEEFATLHIMHLTYIDEKDVLQIHKLCVISDYKEHDVPMIYSSIYEAMLVVKSLFPFIKRIYYFSDDTSGDYKSKSNLHNLCYHIDDFGITAEWHFFSSGHAKRRCSQISAMLKQRATSFTLQSNDVRLSSANDLYEWAKTNVLEIRSVFLSASRVEELSSKIEGRANKTGVISGLPCLHSFIPASISSLVCGETSLSKECRTKNLSEIISFVHPKGTNVAILYASHWWIGMIERATKAGGVYVVLVMQPHGPSNTFMWPERETRCLIPADQILCEVGLTTNGKQYKIKTSSFHIVNCFKEKKKLFYSSSSTV